MHSDYNIFNNYMHCNARKPTQRTNTRTKQKRINKTNQRQTMKRIYVSIPDELYTMLQEYNATHEEQTISPSGVLKKGLKKLLPYED